MLTLMFATFNGERTLPAVLDAYRHLEEPKGGWRLVVIDNGSTDATAQILDRFEPLLPMTRLFVTEPGKNKCLNAGLEKREGDLIVFTDDDAVPANDWLCAYRSAVDANPGFDIFGGVIKPRWERPPEPWILDWVPKGITYSLTDEALKDGPINATSVWGPNMAVRAKLFAEGNRFADKIGPSQTSSYAMGSETDFNRKMELKGHQAWFVSSASVEHLVRGFQMDRAWVLGRASRYGRGLLHRELLNNVEHPKRVLGVPRYQIRRLCTEFARLVAARLTGDARKAFLASWEMRSAWGYIDECRKEFRK